MKIPQKLKMAVEEGRTVFSFEYFPPKTAEGVENLFERLDRMASYQPLFCDITWGAGGSTAELTLDIAKRMQNSVCVETSMHLTCTNMPVEKLDSALDVIKEAGLQNVLALRGDPPHGQDKFTSVEGGFSCALDLVKHMKKRYGDYFGISVAGYPEAHPDAIKDPAGATDEEYRKDLAYLKEKVDAGAEMIITQLFYDVDVFLKFVQDCKDIGINVPIVPGIMPIMTYGGFKRMTGFCKTKVPQSVLDQLEPIKDNEEAVRMFGIHQGTEMCKKLLAHGVKALHMYTLNLEKASVSILQNLGLIDTSKVSRPLPWRPATNVKREAEDVRPIHWANRPRSYLQRTADWDKFPAGRWGNISSPAYGTLNDYQFLRRRQRSQILKKEWGVALKAEEDVFQLFAKYCSGDLASNPWSEVIEGGLHRETQKINERLIALNSAGLLTINSQPAVNGAPSSDADVGWGGPGGYVYQKAYVEFFTSPAKLDALLERGKGAPTVSLLAVNAAGDVKSFGPGTTEETGGINAVTWGVFPGREVVQPTVVDFRSFLVWKDEAFGAWTEEWAKLYAEETEDPVAKEVLEKVKSNYYLVSLVENDYVHGDLFSLLEGL